MKTLTPSETEVLKMFDEVYETTPTNRTALRDFLLTQIRLARADERKKAYEDGKNAAVDYIEMRGYTVGNVFSCAIGLLESARKA